MKRVGLYCLCALVCIACAQDVRAQADVGFKGVGARLSIVFPEDVDATFGLGGLVDLGTFAPNVGFGASLDFWSSSEGPVDFRDVAIGANARYLFTVDNPKVKPYAGGGLAIHFLSVDIPAVTVGGVTFPGGDDSETKIGLDLMGGVAYRTDSNFDIIGEAMFRIVSDFSQFLISGGFVYRFDT